MSSAVHILYNIAQFGFCDSQRKNLITEKSVDEANTAKSYGNAIEIEKNSKIFDLFVTTQTKTYTGVLLFPLMRAGHGRFICDK